MWVAHIDGRLPQHLTKSQQLLRQTCWLSCSWPSGAHIYSDHHRRRGRARYEVHRAQANAGLRHDPVDRGRRVSGHRLSEAAKTVARKFRPGPIRIEQDHVDVGAGGRWGHTENQAVGTDARPSVTEPDRQLGIRDKAPIVRLSAMEKVVSETVMF